jgi:hypothetical protein
LKLKDFLHDHAISEEVGMARPYTRFEQGDVNAVVDHYAGFGVDARDQRKLERLAETVAGQSGGLVIAREGYRKPVPPQLRPDNPVYTSNLRMKSYHPTREDARPIFLRDSHGKQLLNPDGSPKRVRPLTGEARERHIAKYHPEGNVEHLHNDRRAAKYVLPPGAHGRRLDVPRPFRRFMRAQRVFFVIEGSLKTDAILSQGEAAFGVPSVTLWDAPELDRFARLFLRDKDVVIVPDADWIDNPLVIAQAMLCRAYLRDPRFCIRRVCVAAPPLLNGAVESVGGIKRKGVDDHLVLGGSLDDMTVIEREAPDELRAWQVLQFSGHRRDRLARNVEALTKLPLYANGRGELHKSLQSFSRILSVRRASVPQMIADLAEAEVLDVDAGAFEASFQWKDRYDFDWDERPRIRFKPEFRASEVPVRLGDWSNTNPRTRRLVRETHVGQRAAR